MSSDGTTEAYTVKTIQQLGLAKANLYLVFTVQMPHLAGNTALRELLKEYAEAKEVADVDRAALSAYFSI